MSTYFITEPREIPFEAIKAAVLKAYDMDILLNNSGNPTITIPNYVNPREHRLNWLHLLLDAETQTIDGCFRNGASDCSDILEFLEMTLGCRFISEHEPEYWGVKNWSDMEKDE